MNLINAPTDGFTKDEAAKLLGLKSFDTALPQNWLDETCLQVAAKFMSDKAEVPDDIYWTILGGTVWCYDEGSIFGYPVVLTEKAHTYLSKIVLGYPLNQTVIKMEETNNESCSV